MRDKTVVAPGTGYSLFEKIESMGLLPKQMLNAKKLWIDECDFVSFQNAADALCMASPFLMKPIKNSFSFLSSTSLSGAGNPCFDPRCCMARAKALGRFAALYADMVLIRDPFGDILYEEDSEKLRLELILNLGALQLLRPEIEAGIINFAPTHFPLCEEGQKKIQEVEESIQKRVDNAGEQIIDFLLNNLDIKVKAKANYNYLSIRGTERFLPHEGIDIVPLSSKSKLKSKQKLSENEIRREIESWILYPSLKDIFFHHVINWLYDVRYITDRQLDMDLLRLMGETAGLQPHHLRFQESHPLPFVDGLDTKTLIKLRKEEGEAFRVYRDRIRSLVEQSALTELQFREAFRDLVLPELNQIDKSVASVRKMVKREIREKLIFGTGMVTIGLYAGSITPEIGAIVAALGGAKFGADLLSSINTLLSEPSKARENDFYFLWKARDIKNQKETEHHI